MLRFAENLERATKLVEGEHTVVLVAALLDQIDDLEGYHD